MVPGPEIVISGMSGRLPESSNMEEFKEKLLNGVDMVTDDERRWPTNTYGLPSRSAKIKDLHSFDASFFGIHPKLADLMDPQMRLLLEVTYEALNDAGINPSTIKGSRVGVFVGVSTSEYENYWMQIDSEDMTGYELLGSFKSIIANRISFAFDFTGPSYVVDTASSSSLSAMHMAVTAIRAGECDAAIVGGLNLTLRPEYAVSLMKLGALSADGKSKSFDIAADGYVRAEAVVAHYVQKATDARRVYATIVCTKTNTDGNKPQGITYPSGKMQNKLFRDIYNEAKINPVDIDYMEAHGTGTKVGDPEELNSIDEMFCKHRKTPLLIGTLKSIMGHAEAASGLCAISKVLLAMETGVLPGNLHFSVPNPKMLGLTEGRIRVIDRAIPWNGGLVAINSFGFGGSNAHMILRSNAKSKVLLPLNFVEMLPKLITMSGRTNEAVRVLLDKVNEHRRDNEFISLLHAIHNEGIIGHRYRGYRIFDNNNTHELSEEINYNVTRPIWYVFSGMGTQWPGMGQSLLNIEVCKRSLQRCADVLKPHGCDLFNIIMNCTDKMCQNVIDSTVAIVAIQIALVDILTLIGIKPDGIIGHSNGEFCCAYADGSMTLEETISSAYYRGKTMINGQLKLGAMAAVGLSWEAAGKICPDDISLACNNSKDSITISGPPESLETFVEQLKSKGIFTKMVNSCGMAFHSKYMKPIESSLRASLEKTISKPKPRTSKWISTSVPEAKWDSPSARFASPEYYTNNVLSPVYFQEALKHIPDNAIVIEIAPHCLLQAILRRSLSQTVTNIGLQRRDHSNNVLFLLTNVGKLYIAGAQLDVSKLYPPARFPVSRGTPMIGSLIRWDHSTKWKVLTYGKKRDTSCVSQVVKINLADEAHEFYSGHRIDGKIIFPGSGYIDMIWRLFAKLNDTVFEQLPIVLENLHLYRATIMPRDKPVKFLINLYKETGSFQIYESNTLVVTGTIRVIDDIEKHRLQTSLTTLPTDTDNLLPLNIKDVYKEMGLRGYEFRGLFRGIKSCDNYATTGEIYWHNWITFIDIMLQFPLVKGIRKLVYGIDIKYFAIDPIYHKQLVSKLSKDEGVPICYDNNIGIIRSGGMEARDVTVMSQKSRIQMNAKYERYVFVPYENPHCPPKDPAKGRLHALTVLLQIVYENMPTTKIQAVEIASGRPAENLMAPLILNIVNGEPLLAIALEVIASSANNYEKQFNQMNLDIDVVTADVNNALPVNNLNLVIAANILSNRAYNILKNVVNAIKPGCFILLEEDTAQFDLKDAFKSNIDLVLIGKQTNCTGKTYLLLKRQSNKRQQVVIRVTEKNFSWLDNVKAAVKNSDSNSQEVLLVSQGEESFGLVGLMTCIRYEIGGANVRYVFIQDKNASAFDPSAQFYANQLSKGLMANVLKGGCWGSYRYLPLDQQDSVQTAHAYANPLIKYNSLAWMQSPLQEQWSSVSSNTTRCNVYYAAINTRDIMLINGKLSDFPLDVMEDVLGLEFSGRDMDGRRVMGIVKTGGLATTVLADPDFIWKIPDKWTLQEAATVPVAYAISYYALFLRARLQPRESVLIHIDRDGIGLAAVALALHAGNTVFISVKTSESRERMKKIFPKLPDRYIGIHQDINLDQLIMRETHERGIDVVLSPLTNDKLQMNIQCLAANCRFLEFGNRSLPSDFYFSKNMTFHNVILEKVLSEECATKGEIVRLISEGIDSGVIQPLPSIVYTEQQFEGFKSLVANECIGKTLMKFRDEESSKRALPTPKLVAAARCTYMNPKKSYIIAGGLGGFGLELADWMIGRGAKVIVLVTSSGIRTGYQSLCVRRMRENGVNVVISTADITTLTGAERLIKESNQLAPVGGIFNLTAVQHDVSFEDLAETDFKVVALPKINGTKNLDAASRKSCPSLDYFVVFSSTSCGRSIAGQCNYGLANSAMERIIEQRQAAGLPGLAIQWSAIGDTGMRIDSKEDNDIVINDISPQRIPSCLIAIDIFLQENGVLCSTIIVKTNVKKNKSNTINIISTILGIKDINSINPDDKFTNLGMDSLSFLELKNAVEKEFNISLSSQEMFDMTITKLKALSSPINKDKENVKQ